MHNRWLLGIIAGVLLIAFGIFGFVSSLGTRKDLSIAPNVPEAPGQSESTNEQVGDKGTEIIRALPIPMLLEDINPEENKSEFNLIVQEGNSNFLEGLSTPTLGYNGDYLGPVIRVKRGNEVTINVENRLKDATSVHWHGLEVEGEHDGGPHHGIEPGDFWGPTFPIQQKAATLWFHPHVMGTTATQVYYGLAGLIIVDDDNSQSLNLPDDYGVNDIPLILQDRRFDGDGSFIYFDNMMEGAYGDKMLVNGTITPYLEVDQRKMRFRVLNGANARNFKLRLSDSSTFQQIATDGGFLEKPVSMESLFLSPGERAEIIVDFSNYSKGDELELRNGSNLIMTFKIGEEVVDETVVPERLNTINWLDESMASRVKTIDLDGMGHMSAINGVQFDMHRIDYKVSLGDIQIWEISTIPTMMMSSNGHPFHIHGTQFQILSRDGGEVPENERGWKDTVFIGGTETVRIIVPFNYRGVFMYHCHILEHEEAGMMGQLEVY